MEVKNFIDNSLNEEYNDKKKKSLLKKLNVSKYKELSRSIWNDREAIEAANLSYDGMQSRYKEYMKAFNDLKKYTSDSWVESSRHEKGFSNALDAKKKLDGMIKEIKSFENKIKKGTAIAASNRSNANVKNNVIRKKQSDKIKREKFIRKTKSKLVNPGKDLVNSFKKER